MPDHGQNESYLAEVNGNTLTIGAGDVLIYYGAATDDANALAQLLTRLHYFQDRVLFEKRWRLDSFVFGQGRLLTKPASRSRFEFHGQSDFTSDERPGSVAVVNTAREAKLERLFQPAGAAAGVVPWAETNS